MKCSICKKEIKKMFLNKIEGTYIHKKGKKEAICSQCQKAHIKSKG
ncbi:hypothetical protein JW930_07390 [Candidatus Woesearchaeota archaeon]|nr:hypothetical protein [Candidatus Woesearchaeota archaeon]